MANKTVVYRAEGTMVRDINWLNSSHGQSMTAIEEVASQNMIGDMLRYDDGEIISGQFNGKWTPKGAPTGYGPGDAPIIGELIGMEGEVEPVASSIKFSVVIKAERWTPARWDTFGVKTKLIKGDLSDEMLQEDRDRKHSHALSPSAGAWWQDALADERPELIIDDIEIYEVNEMLTLFQAGETLTPIPGSDGNWRYSTLQDAVDSALALIMKRSTHSRKVWHSDRLIALYAYSNSPHHRPQG